MLGRVFLGQVPIRGGTGFEGYPAESYGQPASRGYIPAPSGQPLYSEEMRDPDWANQELHCYSCPGDGGMHRILSIPEARARGCEARPLGECPQVPHAMGDPAPAGGGSGGGMPSGGGGMPSGGGGGPHGGGGFERSDAFLPDQFGFPFYYPNAYPPPSPPQGFTCKQSGKDDQGQPIFDCQPKEPAASYPRYPVVFFRPVF